MESLKTTFNITVNDVSHTCEIDHKLYDFIKNKQYNEIDEMITEDNFEAILYEITTSKYYDNEIMNHFLNNYIRSHDYLVAMTCNMKILKNDDQLNLFKNICEKYNYYNNFPKQIGIQYNYQSDESLKIIKIMKLCSPLSQLSNFFHNNEKITKLIHNIDCASASEIIDFNKIDAKLCEVLIDEIMSNNTVDKQSFSRHIFIGYPHLIDIIIKYNVMPPKINNLRLFFGQNILTLKKIIKIYGDQTYNCLEYDENDYLITFFSIYVPDLSDKISILISLPVFEKLKQNQEFICALFFMDSLYEISKRIINVMHENNHLNTSLQNIIEKIYSSNKISVNNMKNIVGLINILTELNVDSSQIIKYLTSKIFNYRIINEIFDILDHASEDYIFLKAFREFNIDMLDILISEHIEKSLPVSKKLKYLHFNLDKFEKNDKKKLLNFLIKYIHMFEKENKNTPVIDFNEYTCEEQFLLFNKFNNIPAYNYTKMILRNHKCTDFDVRPDCFFFNNIIKNINSGEDESSEFLDMHMKLIIFFNSLNTKLNPECLFKYFEENINVWCTKFSDEYMLSLIKYFTDNKCKFSAEIIECFEKNTRFKNTFEFLNNNHIL